YSLRRLRRNQMRGNFLSLAAMLCALSASGFGAPVYSNTTTDTLDTLAYSANGFTEIGDQIHLFGTDRFATRGTVQFYNQGSAGLFDATLRLFAVGAPVGGQIGGDFVLTGISAPGQNVFNVDFDLAGILVPDNLIFTVSIANQAAGVTI